MSSPVLVVVPVPDAAPLDGCLAAIAAQTVAPTAIVLVEASEVASDRVFPTGEDVAGLAVRVLDARGRATSAIALDRVATLAEAGAVLLCTHPPARTTPDWIAATLTELAAGAEVVAGRLITTGTDSEPKSTPVEHYAALLEEIASLLDPLPGDPWPHHSDESDLSLAITLNAWQRVVAADGALADNTPALMAAVRRRDLVIRHAPDVRVIIPPVGMRHAAIDLEGTDAAARRARLRRLARAAHAGRLRLAQLATGLRLPRRILATWFEQGFGGAWQEIEAHSPVLQRRPISVDDLPQEIERALRLRDGLRAVSPDPDTAVGLQPE